MQKRIKTQMLWGFPLLIYAMDANAWGLFTHIYFAQYVVLSTPMMDSRVQNAIKKFPQLVMAGACLPDLALICKRFKSTHDWLQAQALLSTANSDEELAIAIGYSSHLFVDIVAHNHFVPAFEAKWLNTSIITHISSEWAMDAHIRKHLRYRPFQLLRQHMHTIAPFIAHRFQCSPQQARHALSRLAWADKLLRFSQLSQLCLMRIRQRDDEFVQKLEYYLQQTHQALQQFEPVLQGQTPALFAELKHLSATEMVAWREKCLIEARLRLTTAVQVYQGYQQQLSTPHT